MKDEHKVHLLSPPLCPAPGEGGAEAPSRDCPCSEEEDLFADTEETIGPGLIHEKAHDEGKCTTVEQCREE